MQLADLKKYCKKQYDVFCSKDSVGCTYILNSILRHFFVQNDFKFCIIKPVLRDKHGDITSTDMYCGITSITVTGMKNFLASTFAAIW